MKRKALAVTLRRKQIQRMLEGEKAGKQPAGLRSGNAQAEARLDTRAQTSWDGDYARCLKH